MNERDPRVIRMVVRGHLGGRDEPSFTEHLTSASRSTARDLLVDLTEVTYVTARALRQLVVARRHLRKEGRRLIVIAGEGPVRRAVELAGPGALDVYADEDEVPPRTAENSVRDG